MTFAERTMRLLVIALVLVTIGVWIAMAQEIKSAEERAVDRVEQIWGGSGRVNKYKVVEKKKWVYQVGCEFGTTFIVAGEGDSWSEAFESVNMLTNGPRDLGSKKVFACNWRNNAVH